MPYATLNCTSCSQFSKRAVWTALLIGSLLASTAARAQGAPDLSDLLRQLDELKAEQASTAAKIAAMEATLSQLAPSDADVPRIRIAPAPAAAPGPETGSVALQATSAATSSSWRFSGSGDLRLRYEMNEGGSNTIARGRAVLRARVRGAYAIAPWISVGAQLSTGDADDPNTTDVTLSSFVDDLDVSLDQVYARLTTGPLEVIGGKYPIPLLRTDLVWDSDVSPQGLAATYSSQLDGSNGLKATGIYFIVDEAAAGPDSRMLGGQVAFAGGEAFRYEIAAAYYDYMLRSLAGADAGDFRSNLRAPNGGYLSDFDLFDTVGALTYSGFSDRWPLRLVVNYVKNFGAATDADTGYGADFLLGRATAVGDLRLGYGFAAVETDAVLAAFSHDNTTLATNYLQHTLSLDYVPAPHLLMNATYYRYRPWRPIDAGSNEPRDWLDRLRLNFLVSF